MHYLVVLHYNERMFNVYCLFVFVYSLLGFVLCCCCFFKLIKIFYEMPSGVGLASLGNFLYAMGGHDAPASQDCSKQFDSVERYDPNTDQWTMVASMINCRDAVGVSCLGNKLYAVGGYDGLKYLSAVESYDPQRNEWQEVASLNSGRAAACVVTVPVL